MRGGLWAIAADTAATTKRGPLQYPLQIHAIVKNPIEIRFAVNGMAKVFWRKCQLLSNIQEI